MTADSQPIQAIDGETRVLAHSGRWHTRNPILTREAAGFAGFTGYIGTEMIGVKPTRDWLEAFSTEHSTLSLADYARSLGQELTTEWQRHGLSSVLEILISGIEDGDVRFWFVGNSQGLYGNGTYRAPKTTFDVVDDLDGNYMPNDLQAGQTKEELLRERVYSFRQGALLPAAGIFDAFRDILETLYVNGIDGFTPMNSLDALGHFARMRMEFAKRLYSKKHGIYRNPVGTIGGKVQVVGVGRDGAIRSYSKIR